MPCWNPSGSSRFNIDTTALMDPNQYCQPPPEAPYCTTSTWQYSTKDFFGSSTSHWIGINRGCATSKTTSATGAAASGNNRAVSGLLENIRLYLPTNTAAQARDNARYPTGNDTASFLLLSILMVIKERNQGSEYHMNSFFIKNIACRFYIVNRKQCK